MPRFRLTVAYDGTDFHGWQKQSAEEPLRTAQMVLEEAVRHTVQEPVNVMGASRTDSGVHARGQVAAFTCSLDFPPDRLAAAINSRLPDDMQVRDARVVPESFSPISDAIAKGYSYRIAHDRCDGRLPPLFARRTTFSTPYALDPSLMNDAARRIIGEHDFASFTRLNHGRETTVRTIFDCKVEAAGRRLCRIDVAGNGFLHNMVRIIAGTLLEVGRGKLSPEAIEGVLAARDRSAAGPTLRPEGLCLMWVDYGQA